MALKKTNENPRITDTILIEIETPDVNGCLTGNPYKVDRLVIYYVERDFLGSNFGEYTTYKPDEKLQKKLMDAHKAFCANPTEENFVKVEHLRQEIESKAQKNTFYYKDRIAVHVVGSEGFPAWLSTDTENSYLKLEATDADGNPQVGKFSYEWHPNGSIREGDYFACWTWTPLPAGDKLSAHIQFSVNGDPAAVTSLPAHRTPEEKYQTLLDRYLPEMYKTTLVDNDLTPTTLAKLNTAVGDGFTFIEDMANQIIDLFDANVLHESLLVYLSNLFNIKLKSSDPTLWRRQIKQAIPLFKKKGTLDALKEAFAQSGMVLHKFTQYWQLTSPYTSEESFRVKKSPTFTLSKNNIVTPIDDNNFGLWIKRAGTTSYIKLTKDYVEFETAEDGTVRMTWIGDELSASPVQLHEGDRIKVLYQYKSIPNNNEQQLENYIRALPLADQRDEDAQEYPLKNWNVRLIAEEDPLFDVLVPVRHPFQDPLIFGWVRTEFAYSENIYNMEEYNGSTRPSFDPCYIDKEFLDPCRACLSSLYTVDIGIEDLSNDRILEAQDILNEYTPFHAQVHSINFAGETNEFVQPPVETIESLITFDKLQHVLSGNSNPIFHRFMEGGLENWVVTRKDLTDQLTVLSGKIGIAYSDHIALIAPDILLDSLGMSPDSHILEVLAPSVNAGTYYIADPKNNTARVTSTVSETPSLDQSAFTFNLSNILYGTSNTTITQDNLYELSDEEVDFAKIGVKTLWDVEHTPDYTGGAWKVLIPAYSATPYEIKDIRNGVLVLKGDNTLPISNTSNISYTLKNDSNQNIATSDSGHLKVELRGYVNLNDGNILDLRDFADVGDYLFYDGTEYLIVELDGNNFWIKGYTDGDAAGVSTHTRRRLADKQIGYFGYRGQRMTTWADHESEFEMVNGRNSPPEDQIKDDSHFKENFLFEIEGEYYKIIDIDKKEVVLAGRDQNWKTMNAGGTAVAYKLIHLPKKQVNVGFIVFDYLDHNGKDPVIREIESTVDNNTAIMALSTTPGSGVQENVSQEEGISFFIEKSDGKTYEGEI
jgi:hypothetical protein